MATKDAEAYRQLAITVAQREDGLVKMYYHLQQSV